MFLFSSDAFGNLLDMAFPKGNFIATMVIGGYFLTGIESVGGCPKTVRADLGTANGVVENIQSVLHTVFNGNDSTKSSFMYGKSVHNQRIESWWCILRKHSAQFWMNLFQMLKDDGLYDGTFLDKSLLQYCFMELIQDDLNQVTMEWNTHRIRESRNSISPGGRPTIMFEMPTLYGVKNCMTLVPPFAIDAVKPQCTFLEYPCDKVVFDLCNILMAENRCVRSTDAYKTIDLYVALRNLLKNELHQ